MQSKDISIDSDLLYLIGITSIFIACKHEETRPLAINLVYSVLGHKKFPPNNIRDMERKILE